MSMIDFVDWLSLSKERGFSVYFICCHWTLFVYFVHTVLRLLLSAFNTYLPVCL